MQRFLLGVVLALWLCAALADQIGTEIVTVPAGVYVYSENPECGVRVDTLALAKDPKVVGTITQINPVAGAITVAIAQADALF